MSFPIPECVLMASWGQRNPKSDRTSEVGVRRLARKTIRVYKGGDEKRRNEEKEQEEEE